MSCLPAAQSCQTDGVFRTLASGLQWGADRTWGGAAGQLGIPLPLLLQMEANLPSSGGPVDPGKIVPLRLLRWPKRHGPHLPLCYPPGTLERVSAVEMEMEKEPSHQLKKVWVPD